ncbi:MAG TPA: TetR family transcriptional regulator C-terminal domain-containing protein [Methylomirabilota bacterium]|nr:TetR family transcriptional regulator C-terminal domain-containing protein [Methylomirabilota bacterium]
MKRKAPRPAPVSPPVPPRVPAPIPESAADTVRAIEERFAPIVAAVDRVARGSESPAVRLEGAMEIIFGAYGQSDPDFSELLLAGWTRARHDKHHRLALAWQREQLRLALQEILEAGTASGAFRKDLDAGAVAAVILGAAEGCLLQAATQGGAVPPGEIVRTLLSLALSGA